MGAGGAGGEQLEPKTCSFSKRSKPRGYAGLGFCNVMGGAYPVSLAGSNANLSLKLVAQGLQPEM